MKTFKPDLKKITGLLGALLFAGSLMIGQLPSDANADPILEGSCLGICQKASGSECSATPPCFKDRN